ncbi:MAG: hypothetical protein ABI624_08245, partial [Casimicrobiaceae bacterium]
MSAEGSSLAFSVLSRVLCGESSCRSSFRYNSTAVPHWDGRFIFFVARAAMSSHMTPEEIVSELDKNIVGQ